MKAKIPQSQEAAAAFVKKVCTPAPEAQKTRAAHQPLAGITINRPSRCTIVIGSAHPTRAKTNR